MALGEKGKDRLRRVIRSTMIVVAVFLLVVALVIPVANNAVALGVENELKGQPLPPQTELVESTSLAGKLTGNGNGMQYFGAILIRSDLTEEELSIHYPEYAVEAQKDAKISAVDHADLAFNCSVSGEDYYIVYAWGSAPAALRFILNLDIRGH